MTFSHLLPGSRDPSSLLAETMKTWDGHGDIWVFGYASLIWRPEFDAAEQRPATVYGWHRALADAIAREPRHARATRPRLRAGAWRLLPRHGLPHP